MRTRLTGVLVLLTICLGTLAAQFASAERGVGVLRDRQCLECHADAGRGTTGAPDLAQPSQQFTPASLTAKMWTHGPRMWRLMKAKGLSVPHLSQTDIRDLFAYFYDRQYFDPSGDAGHGAGVFERKGCAGCHSPTIPDTQRRGPSVVEWPMIGDAVRWGELMWNHADAMIFAASEAGVRWPRLTVQDMMDLLVYLENMPGQSAERPTLVLNDPNVGEELFRQRSCSECHTLGVKERGKRDLLAATRKFRTLAEFAVAMWNHAPRMARRAKRLDLEFPRFQAGEMGHVISLLFVRQYFEAEGNWQRGQRVFESRACGKCHAGERSGAPPLRGTNEYFSVSRLAAAVWQHGPKMRAAMQERSIEWPILSERDVLDLIAYLNRP